MSRIIHLTVDEAETVPRPYGVLHLLTPISAHFKNVHLQMITIKPTLSTSYHYHPMEELFFVLAGSGVLETERGEYILQKDTIVLVPPNETHQLRNMSNVDPLKYLLIMSPPWDPEKVTYIDPAEGADRRGHHEHHSAT